MPDLQRVLNPRTAAVVGDKKASGYMWLKAMESFTGTLYSVQVDPNEIPGIEALGVANYPSLSAIPEPVDFAICAVPRKIAPFILKDAIAAGVGGMTMFTSGFAETDEEEGIVLQEQIRQTAAEADFALIGPNCMGLHIPELGVRFNQDQPHGQRGNIGFLSQSGTHGMNFSLAAAANGLYCSRLVSFGNAIVLGAPEYLRYLADDPQTEAIGAYLEGAGDGRRLMEALRYAAARKPVVTWKGGQTAAGARATHSHTGSLATNQVIWDAVIAQTGAISVDNLDEMVDVMQALLRTRPAPGRGVGLMAMTGGQSVVITDAFAKAGWDVPLLSDASYAQLAGFFNVIGGSYKNPLDMAGTVMGDPATLDRIFTILDADPNLHAFVVELSASIVVRRWADKPEDRAAFLDRLADFAARSAKPLIATMHPVHMEAETVPVRQELQARGIATFASFERAATALAKATAGRTR